MHTVISVDLAGQERPFRLHEDAYAALRQYLDHARARLGGVAESAEVIEDLERSIGERLAALGGPTDRIIEAGDVAAILEEVGTVDLGTDGRGPIGLAGTGRHPAKRRLYRIRESQQIAGVCTGLAAYADLRLDWVRTIVVALTLLTAGVFILAYLVLMFLLPVIGTRAEWVALMEQADGAAVS